MTERDLNNLYIPQTTQEKVDATKWLLRNNVSTGEYTWAGLRKKCGYEIIWGNADNQRERQRFKSLIHQLADVEELSTTKCRIKEIYTEGKVIIDDIDQRSVGNNTGKGIWQRETKYALMAFLSKQIDPTVPPNEKQTFFLSSDYLCKVIGLVNIKYNNQREELLFLNENPSIKKTDIRNMKFHCKSAVERILYSALQNIQKSYGGISWRETYRFFEQITNSEDATIVLSEYTATQKDIHNIDAVYKRMVLDEMGAANLRVLYLHNKQEQYYDKVLAMFNEDNGTNYTQWYRTNEICVTPSQFYSALDTIEKELLSFSSLTEKKKICNDRFLLRLENHTKKSYETAVKKVDKYISSFSQDILDMIDIGFYTEEELVQAAHLFKYDSDYLTNQEKCRNAFVKLA